MKKICDECSKKLGLIGRYNHPLDKKKTICSKCLEWIVISLKYYNECLFERRGNHKKDCYFWDKDKHVCKNEKYFDKIDGEGK